MASDGELTRARAIALLTELVEAFGRKTFQRKLGKLAAKHVSNALSKEPIRHVGGRRDLVFGSQRDVMQRYGFPAHEDGILKMKIALRSHLDDASVLALSIEARVLLRIPQMKSPRGDCGTEVEEYPFLGSPELPSATEAAAPSEPDYSDVFVALPPPPPEVLEARFAARRTVDIRVTNPVHKTRVMVKVPRQEGKDPTVGDIKAAIIAQMGEGAVDHSSFQVVVDNGGIYGVRPDDEVVRMKRVLALGVSMAAAIGA